MKTVDLISRIGAIVGGGCVVGMGGVIIASVFMRFVLHRPILWPEEVAGYLMLGCVFLVLASAQLADKHVKLDIVILRLSPRVQRYLGVITSFAALLFAFLLIWQGSRLAWRSYVFDAHSESLLGPSLAPLQLVIPVGAALLSVAIVAGMVKLVRQKG